MGFSAGQLNTLANATTPQSITAAWDTTFGNMAGTLKINATSVNLATANNAWELSSNGIAQLINNEGIAGVTASRDPATGHLKLTSASRIIVDDSGITTASIGWTAADETAAAGSGGSGGNQFTVTAGPQTSLTYQLGDTSSASDQITATINGMSLSNLGLGGLNSAVWTGDATGRANAKAYLKALDTAVDYVNTERGAIGASQKQIGYQTTNLETRALNTQTAASGSRIQASLLP
jgi:flagellin-like hook-associated protein FlgL